MLHPVSKVDWDRTIWCGPGVLSVLTGKPVGEMAELCARIQKTKAAKVKGTYDTEIILALYELGYQVREIDLAARWDGPPTLRRFMEGRLPDERVFPVLIGIWKHWGACHFDYFCDNHTVKPVPYMQAPRLKRPVVSAWKIMTT